MSDGDRQQPGNSNAERDVQPYIDAADRTERTLDAQLRTIDNIDARAGFIIRVVGVLLGVVVSATSILATVTTGSTSAVSFSAVAVVAAIVATIGLLAAMILAIITYLSSSPITGLEYQTADLLSSAEYNAELKSHLRRTLGLYAHALRMNATVIQVNAARFRLSLVALATGVIYGTLAAALIVAQLGSLIIEGVMFAVVTVITAKIVQYILEERYKVEEPEEVNEDDSQEDSTDE